MNILALYLSYQNKLNIKFHPQKFHKFHLNKVIILNNTFYWAFHTFSVIFNPCEASYAGSTINFCKINNLTSIRTTIYWTFYTVSKVIIIFRENTTIRTSGFLIDRKSSTN